VLMWAADDTQTTPELWQAFSLYQWKQGGPSIPAQPIGWAKIKAPRGIWVRSSPHGAKVGALAKAELTPIWSVTNTQWGAITKSGDRWIFLGDTKTVDTTLESSAAEPPSSSPPELYQARVVPGRGLNVRDGIEGRILRALPYNTIVRVYEERSNWVRIHPTQSEWVNAFYLSKVAEPAYA